MRSIEGYLVLIVIGMVMILAVIVVSKVAPILVSVGSRLIGY